MSIFNTTSFTLKELCSLFLLENKYNNLCENNIKVNKYNKLRDIACCYTKFTSRDDEYHKFLKVNNEYRNFLKVRLDKGFMYSIEDNNINFREILQKFDMNFNKLMIKINIDSEDYNITVTWDDIEREVKGFTKIKFKEFYDDLIIIS
jgi:hypothetical protein